MSRGKRHRKNSERKNGADALREWQRERLARDRELPVPAPGPSEVSLVAYHVRPAAAADEDFLPLEAAIRESWRHCGFLHTVIVAPAATPALAAFAEPYGTGVEIAVVPSLDPERPETEEEDRIARLPERFATPFALLVSADGFPLRPGLGSFLDHWDFIGAPLVSEGWWGNLVRAFLNTHVMDGGFSLRSRALCERVAEEWKARGGSIRKPEDGAFQTRLLPRKSLSYRSSVRLPMAHEANAFSYDAAVPFHGRIPPFGFHGPAAFKWLLDNGKIS